MVCVCVDGRESSCICTAETGTALATQELHLKLNTIEKDEVEGSLAAIELDAITLRVDGTETKYLIEQVDSIVTGIDSSRPTDKIISVRLVDGSTFNAKSFSIKAKKLAIQLFCGLDFLIDTRNVETLRFKTYSSQIDLAKQWREIIEDPSREGDALVVNRSDELNTIDGILGETQDKKLGFSIGARTAMVGFEKIDAVLFYHAKGRELASPICNILLADQSLISSRRLDWKDSNLLVTSVAGAKFSIPIQSIVKMDFSLGRDEVLSDFEPSTNDWQALITSSAIMEKLRRLKIARVNQSFSGEPLSLKFFPENGIAQLSEIRQFANGFAIQGGGKLAFTLNGRFKHLNGWVGFDPKASRSGNVKFTVLADGKPLVEKHLTHRTMEQPLQLDLNIKDVKRIVFQVDYYDGRSTGDQLHLVELRVSQ